MLSTNQLKRLKQVNVSQDAEKTMARFKEDFSSARSDDKSRIVELSGQKRNSIYRVLKKGSVNARLIYAMAKVLEITPFYYTGEQDNKEPLTEELLVSFLKNLGYTEILSELGKADTPKTKRPYNRKPKQEQTTLQPSDESLDVTLKEQIQKLPEGLEAPSDISQDETKEANEPNDCETISISLSFENSFDMQKTIAELNEDDAILLLKSLLIRARVGGNAKQLSDVVKRCLLA